AVLLPDVDRFVLVADDFAGIDDGFEQVAHAEAADDTGEFRPNRAPFVDEAMASRAPHRAIKLPATLEVAFTLKPAFDHGHKFLQLPFLDQGARGQNVARRFAFDARFEDGLERSFLV